MLKQMQQLTGRPLPGLKKNILWGFAEGLCTGLAFFCLYIVVDEMFAVQPDMPRIWQSCWAIAGLFILRLVASRRVMLDTHMLGYDAGNMIRDNLAGKLKRVPLSYLLKVDPGALNATMLSDVSFTENIFSHLFAQLVVSVSLALLIALGLGWQDWRLALAMISGLPLGLLVFFLLKRRSARLAGEFLASIASMSGLLMEYVQGIKELKAYNLTGKRFRLLDNELKHFSRLALRHELIAGLAPLGFICCVESGFATMVLAAVYLFSGGVLSVEVMVLFLIISNRFFKPVLTIALHLAEYNFMDQAAKRVLQVLSAEELPTGTQSNSLNAQVRFSRVSFAYEQHDVLKDISLTCRPGTLTALVGPSGSGKTTLTSLIARFWDVQQGEIQIGGTDIRSLTPECLADQHGVSECVPV